MSDTKSEEATFSLRLTCDQCGAEVWSGDGEERLLDYEIDQVINDHVCRGGMNG